MYEKSKTTNAKPYIVLSIIYIFSSIFSIIASINRERILYPLFKGLVMPSIMGYAHLAWEGTRDKKYIGLQLAFTSAWLGDVFLALPKGYTPFFFAGGLFFLLQHIFYIWLNLSAKNPENDFWQMPYWGIPSTVYIVLISVIYWAKCGLILKMLFGLYSIALGTSFYTAFYRGFKNKSGYLFGVIGFGLFVISDILIIIDNLVVPLKGMKRSFVLITYYLAQSIICVAYIEESKVLSPK